MDEYVFIKNNDERFRLNIASGEYSELKKSHKQIRVTILNKDKYFFLILFFFSIKKNKIKKRIDIKIFKVNIKPIFGIKFIRKILQETKNRINK